jgi:hypothetical protein
MRPARRPDSPAVTIRITESGFRRTHAQWVRQAGFQTMRCSVRSVAQSRERLRRRTGGSYNVINIASFERVNRTLAEHRKMVIPP